MVRVLASGPARNLTGGAAPRAIPHGQSRLSGRRRSRRASDERHAFTGHRNRTQGSPINRFAILQRTEALQAILTAAASWHMCLRLPLWFVADVEAGGSSPVHDPDGVERRFDRSEADAVPGIAPRDHRSSSARDPRLGQRLRGYVPRAPERPGDSGSDPCGAASPPVDRGALPSIGGHGRFSRRMPTDSPGMSSPCEIVEKSRRANAGREHRSDSSERLTSRARDRRVVFGPMSMLRDRALII